MKFIILGITENFTGYGQHTEHTGRQLERLGHQVRYSPVSEVPCQDSYFKNRLAKRGEEGTRIQITFPSMPVLPGTIFCTTWESDRLPAEYISNVNKARLVIVNSRFTQDAFVRSGVKVPVVVVPLGISPSEYYPLYPMPEDCRFGVVANLLSGATRKNLQGVVEAFRVAFNGEPDVSLTIKTNCMDKFEFPGDRDIAVIRGFLSTARMNWLYNSFTCLVSGSLGEGFGLCPLQAMACGRPAIATAYSGHAEYLDDTVGYPVKYDIETPSNPGWGGTLARPSVLSMADRMREVYENRKGVMVKGERALARAKLFTWDRYGERLLEAIRGAVG